MTGGALGGRLVIVPLAVVLEPRSIHRARVNRLQPGPAQGGGGQQE
jgi:hypothetical protein